MGSKDYTDHDEKNNNKIKCEKKRKCLICGVKGFAVTRGLFLPVGSSGHLVDSLLSYPVN